jgi:hypothetical protein
VLTGQFLVQLAAPGPGGGVDYPWFLLDLAEPAVVHGPSHVDPDGVRAEPGDAPGWSGRVVGFVADGVRSGELRLDGTASCGPARYHATWDDGSLRLSPIDDACGERVNVLAAKEWTHWPLPLLPSRRYESWSFGEPFRFQVPDALAPGPSGSIYAWTWLGPGRMKIGMIWWHGLFVDDEPLYVDACDPTKGTLTDVPGTPAAVGDWLRSNPSLTLRGQREIDVDGGTAYLFETDAPDCSNGRGPSFGPTVPAGRLYAIPTGHDTILYVTWSDGGVAEFDSASDELVRSMTFD